MHGATDEPDNSHAEITPPLKIEKEMKPTYIYEDWEQEIVMNSKALVITDNYFGDDVFCHLFRHRLTTKTSSLTTMQMFLILSM